jgi:DNA-binding protein HU-beta
MNKEAFVEKLADKTGMTKKQANQFTTDFVETMTEAIATEGKLAFVGFGTFEKKRRKARVGRNPKNPAEVVEVPASVTFGFKAGKLAKARMK